MNIINYKIKNSVVSAIDDEQAKVLDKEGVYYTEGKELERVETGEGENLEVSYTELIVRVYDLDKNSIIPELKFLDTYKSGGNLGFNFFGPGFIFIVFLAGIFLYFQFQDSPDTSVPISDTGSVVTPASTPISSSLTPPVQNTTIEEEAPAIQVTPVVSSENSLEIQNSQNKQIIEGLELSQRRKDYELQDLRLSIQKLTREKAICENDFIQAKNLAKSYLQEGLEKTSEIESLKSRLLDNNQLYLYLGEYVFGLCENQPDDAKCKQLIFNFYNTKK